MSRSKKHSGSGIFGDIVDGIAQGVRLLGGRISALEEHVDAPELTSEEYIEKFEGSGIMDDIWDTTKTVIKHPVTQTVLHAALPIAFKVLAGRVVHLEEHLNGGATRKKRGGAYDIAGEEHGGAYRIAGKAPVRKRGGAYEVAGAYDIGGAYEVAGKVARKAPVRKRGGDLMGTTQNSKPPISQRAMTLEDLLE